MGIQKQDPEYLRAKYAFTRDLIQFHESRGTGLQCDPKINGKEVDLYLLYQIVTSHGGWEKINLRNEWDKLLEHFHLPRSTNGGLAIKQIYLRYLELYEKIHYLGEDVDAKEEPEDEYESDFRGRRRFPNKLSSSSHHHHHHHHSSTSTSTTHSHHHAKEITDHNRSQLGLSSRILESSDYDGLLLSLQSPLPNEQDMAISVCTLLSNETKHVLRFSKSPAILNMLLAHAGIYQDCGMRLLMEETYKEWRDMDYAEFWEDVLHHPDTRQLLCECFVKRMNASLGLTEDEGSLLSQIQEVDDGDLSEEEKFSLGTALRLKLARLRQTRGSFATLVSLDSPMASDSPTATKASSVTGESEKPDQDAEGKVEDEATEKVTCNGLEESSGTNEDESNSVKLNDKVEDSAESIVEEDVPEVKTEEPRICCPSCPCRRIELVTETEEDASQVDFSIQRPSSNKGRVMVDDAGDGPMNSLPLSLRRTQNSGDKVGQRICQIAHILRNLSFEQDNALVMSKNPTLMRFLLVTANCTFSSLAQTSFDIIGNISSHLKLEEPLRDPLSSMFLTLVTSGVFSTDRFKILRSLEAIRELTKVEGNENIITRYIESRVYRRMCDLLTLSDIMLLIYTLECILSMTGLGEAVCDEIVRVQGSVATLVSLVTVEAQSYGPKGCILMRVVETVTGATASTSQASPAGAPSPVPSTSQTQPAQQQQQQAPVAIPQPVVPPTQHLLQQQLQQPPNPIYSPMPVGIVPVPTPARPSPANSPGLKMVTGTTVVPPVIQGQSGAQFFSQPLQQQMCKLTSVSGQLTMPSNVHSNSQVFNHPIPSSSPNLINHLNSSPSISTITAPYAPPMGQTGSALQMSTSLVPPPKPSALPSSSISENPSIKIPNNCKNGNAVVTVAPSHGLPPGATAVVIQQQNASASPAACPPGNIQPVAAAVNGVPSLVTANLPQISNHSLSQHHVVTPSISLVTPRGTLSEEAWAIAWLKGTFESTSGTSIEQGEIYRMYSAARKNPNVVLSLEQFVQCVKCAYGASVGPVIKQFGGGTTLPFFEGIKPKIAIRAVGITPVSAAQLQAVALKAMGGGSGANPVVAPVTSAPATTVANPQLPPQVPVSSGAPNPTATNPQIVQIPAPPSPAPLHPAANVSQVDGETVTYLDANANNSNDNGNVDGATHPVSVNIPSREAKPSLSPILQATLSQPPKAKANSNRSSSPTTPTTGSLNAKSSRGKNQKKKDGKQSSKQKKAGLASTSSGNALPQKLGGPVYVSSGGNSAFSPASSAIRSLLASKVAQRQQNKLHQQLPKNALVNDKGSLTHNTVSKEDNLIAYPSSEVVKVNGIGPDASLDKIEESSASSSLLSSDGSDNSAINKSAVPITSFHGVLHNGQANLDVKNELSLEGVDSIDCVGKNRAQMKGMLIDLLERRVPSREPVNGIVAGREIRISEKGLELIEKMEESLAAGSSGPALVNHSNSTCPSSDVQESQKMTFYSSTSDAQVTLQGQTSPVGPGLSGSAGVTLVSGGGAAGTITTTNSTLALRPGGQQVKFCGGKIIRLIEHAGLPLCAPMVAAVATSTATAEVQSTAVPVATAAAFCHGDGLITSSADAVAATPANGEVTYLVDDSGQSAMIVDVVESVIANANSVTLDSGSNGDGSGGGDGQNIIFIDGGGDAAASSSDTHNKDNNNGTSYNAELNCNNGSGTASGDLLERFSQFSDLIMVPPEQLANLKRPSSPLPPSGTAAVVPGNNNNNSTGDDLPPPMKKQVMDSTIVQEAEQVEQTNQAGTGRNVQSSTTANVTNNVTIATTMSMAPGVVTPTTTTSLPPGAGAQVVQLPLRLSVNPQNPQQLTFTRQLVLPSGQQLLLSTGNSQGQPLQGQVIISKSQGSNSDQMPKAIIILQQPQQQNKAGTSQPVTTSQNLAVACTIQQQIQATSVIATTVAAPLQTTMASTTSVLHQQVPLRPAVIPSSNLQQQVVTLQQHQLVQQANAAGSSKVPTQQAQMVHQVIGGQMHHATVQSPMLVQQQQQISQTGTFQHHHQHATMVHPQAHGFMMKPINYSQFEGVRSSNYPHLTSDQLDLEYPFLCEWAGCGLRFLRPQQVSMHALKVHCPEVLVDAVRCEWGQNGCDPLLRKRFSLMTHLQDRHCSKQALEMALYRRKNKIEPPPVPQQPIHHPGYAPNAAFHAIKRHAMSFMSTKEHLHDDNEGPVTKSIRLTAALILRNLVNYSGLGRRMLHGYESHLSSIAMSNVESSRTIAQLLHDMNDQPKSSK